MRPTRWTRGKRLTKPGKGGWHLGRYGPTYTHPVSGDGYSAGWNLRRLLALRRDQERRRGRQADERDVRREFGEWN